jgi:hypothetical protein
MFRHLVRLMVCVVGSTLVLTSRSMCRADVVAIGPTPSAPTTAIAERDLLLTMEARRLLGLDPQLATLNLGVSIRNRIATLWGPVPSAELGFKAELHLRRLVELSEIRNELIVTGEGPTAWGGTSVPPAFLPPPGSPGLPAVPSGDAPPALPPPLAPAPSRVTPRPVIEGPELPALRLPKGK